MANCSIPNSILANGRTSTTSLRQSKKRNSKASRCEAFALTKAILCWPFRFFNAQPAFAKLRRGRRSTLNSESFREQAAQRLIRPVGRWALDVERWTFSSSRRVKGAWWPSRSSKPSSSRKCRGRFDSYPLRQFFHIVILSEAKSKDLVAVLRGTHRDSSTSLGMTNELKGGEPPCPVSKSAN